jgi:hypothetical protein
MDVAFDFVAQTILQQYSNPNQGLIFVVDRLLGYLMGANVVFNQVPLVFPTPATSGVPLLVAVNAWLTSRGSAKNWTESISVFFGGTALGDHFVQVSQLACNSTSIQLVQFSYNMHRIGFFSILTIISRSFDIRNSVEWIGTL